eukprot:5248017-Lingulodinium_polyedra.AAC.1
MRWWVHLAVRQYCPGGADRPVPRGSSAATALPFALDPLGVIRNGGGALCARPRHCLPRMAQ